MTYTNQAVCHSQVFCPFCVQHITRVLGMWDFFITAAVHADASAVRREKQTVMWNWQRKRHAVSVYVVHTVVRQCLASLS